MKKDRIAVVMAAGKSDAMNSKKTKLVHKLYGKELVTRVVETAEKLKDPRADILRKSTSPFFPYDGPL